MAWPIKATQTVDMLRRRINALWSESNILTPDNLSVRPSQINAGSVPAVGQSLMVGADDAFTWTDPPLRGILAAPHNVATDSYESISGVSLELDVGYWTVRSQMVIRQSSGASEGWAWRWLAGDGLVLAPTESRRSNADLTSDAGGGATEIWTTEATFASTITTNRIISVHGVLRVTTAGSLTLQVRQIKTSASPVIVAGGTMIEAIKA